MKLRFVFTLLALGCLSLLISGCGKRDEAISTQFPQRHQVVVKLPVQSKGEAIRYALMYPDGKTPKEVRIEFTNGTAKLLRFREDGKLLELREFYSVDDSKASAGPRDEYERQLKKVMVYDPTLKVAVSGDFFHKDGSREAQGRRQKDGTLEQLVFKADGRSIERYQIFAADGKVTSERAFGDNGNTLSLARRIADGRLETTTYRADGTKASLSLLRDNDWEDVDFYKEDGTSLWITVRRYYTIGLVSYSDNGEVREYREFSDGEMKVVSYVAGSGKTSASWTGVVFDEDFRQYWKVTNHTTDSGKTEEVYTLDRVEVIGKNGKVKQRLIYSQSDGSLVKVEDYDDDGVDTQTRVLRADGTVERIDYYVDGRLDHSQDVAPEKAMKEKVDSRVTTASKFIDPRPLVKPPVKVPPPTWSYPTDYDGD